MGRTGTEVTREAAAMVLTDDNYASIVAAVEEGRGIYDNIQKTLVYLVASNAAEILVVLGAALLGWPIPLLPLHLLWINLVTDGLPALALVMDPAPRDALERPPRPPGEPMLGRTEWRRILAVAAVETAVVLGTFGVLLTTRGLAEARAMAFATLVFSEVLRVLAARSPARIFWEVGAFTNLKLVAVVLASLVLQIALIGLPATGTLFGVTMLTTSHVAVALALGLVPVSAWEIAKLASRWRGGRRARSLCDRRR